MNDKPLALIFRAILLLVGATLPAHAQLSDSPRWVSEKENMALWTQIRSDFHDELQPDDPAKVAPVVAYAYKYIHRVALYRDSALVIVGHLETKESRYPGYYSAFSYDVRSHARTPIKGPEIFSLFKFVKFASITAGAPGDIVFTWMTCTECEASQVLSAFHYNADTGLWVSRSWETSKDVWWTGNDGPTIWTDTAASDVLSFDCLHGFVKSDGREVFGIRCREVDQADNGKSKVTDITLRYTFDVAVAGLQIMPVGEERNRLLAELCEQAPKNKLCKNKPARPAQP